MNEETLLCANVQDPGRTWKDILSVREHGIVTGGFYVLYGCFTRDGSG